MTQTNWDCSQATTMTDDLSADLPRAEDCTRDEDLGRLHHNAERDIWYLAEEVDLDMLLLPLHR